MGSCFNRKHNEWRIILEENVFDKYGIKNQNAQSLAKILQGSLCDNYSIKHQKEHKCTSQNQHEIYKKFKDLGALN